MIRTLFLLLALASPAGAFQLAFPAACTLGKTCYIQQYADHDPGPGADDYTCGALSYQGHDGTDIALPSRAAMQAGVNVLAAAAGIVKATRDGIVDFAPALPGKECGNGVVIDHAEGWQTQYCHMKQGSVVVHAGDNVQAGAVLGQIGQTGMAAFPHVHLTLRHNGVVLDPFAPDSLATCGPGATELWLPALPYQPGGLIATGISATIPQFDAIKAGLPSPDLPATAAALVVWTSVYGSQAGDIVQLSLTGPEGQVVNEQTVLEKPQALLFRAAGKKRKADLWPSGRYTGSASLIRDSMAISTEQVEITIAP